MPLILEPEVPAYDLRGRLAQLRRRSRTRILMVGGVAVVAGLLFAVALMGWIDYALDMPRVLRACLLLGWLAAGAYAWRAVRQRWLEAGDELRLALAVERKLPGLHDALASALEFESEAVGSPQLRDATVLYAVQRTRSVDFDDLTERRPIGRSLLLGCLGVMMLAGLLRTAGTLPLVRFINPIGNHPWPTRTRIDVAAPTMLARGDAFECTFTISGVIPDRAVLQLALEGAANVEQSYALTPQPDGGQDVLPLKFEPARVPRNFRYQLTANDGTTGWRSVEVRVPPQLAPLEGRASPLLRLAFPRYSDLKPLDLPDGAGAIEAVLGTSVRIRAATDQPIAAAAVEYRPSDPRHCAALASAAFATADLWQASALHAMTAATPLMVSDDGLMFNGAFTPLLSGGYELSFRAAAGPPGHRPLEVRVLTDPSPAVTIDAPSGEGVELLPDAAFALQATITDPMFAIRQVEFIYRTRGDEPWQTVPMYDSNAWGRALATLLTPLPPDAAKLRPTRLKLDRRLNVAAFRHANGKPLAVGDVLTLAVVARDFDDVSPMKPAGRSAEVEVRIVGRDRVDQRLHQARMELLKNLKQTRELQRNALAQTTPAETHRRANGELAAGDREQLGQALSAQSQVLDRLGDEHEGVRADARRLQQMLADNPGSVPESGALAAQTVRELDRLAREVLESAPALLRSARQETGGVPPADRATGALPDAVRRQTEAERSLREMIEQLEAGGAAAGMAAEAAAIAAEQKLLQNRRDELASRVPAGVDPNRLPEAERQGLAQAKEQQEALGQRAAELARQLDAKANELRQQADAENKKADEAERAIPDLAYEYVGPKQREAERARDKAESLKREAAALTEAGKIARGENASVPRPPLAETMKRAAGALAGNRLAEAQQQQQAAGVQLEQVRDKLNGAAQPDLDRLTKERRRAEQQVDEIIRQQETLQDRTLAAEQQLDRLTRKKQLEELEREQSRLANEARDAARELNRQGQTDAARDMENAARQMDKAREQMANGEAASSAQDDALERLDDAIRQAEQARGESEERLRREALIKLSDRVKGLTDRQTSMAAEGERLFQTAKAARSWSRAVQKSLADLGRDQEALGGEVGKFAEQQLAKYPVFRKIAEQAATAMAEVNVAVEEARNAGLTPETLDADRAAIRTPQELANKRLNQLQAALRPAKDDAKQPPSGGNQPGQGADGSGSNSSAPPGDNVPPLAQLKLLRDLQVELRDQIDEFTARSTDPAKWTPADKAKLDRLRREQAELAELFTALTPSAPLPLPETKKQ